jgi:hypothetical protein
MHINLKTMSSLKSTSLMVALCVYFHRVLMAINRSLQETARFSTTLARNRISSPIIITYFARSRARARTHAHYEFQIC